MNTAHADMDDMGEWAVSNPMPKPAQRDELAHHFIDAMPEEYDEIDEPMEPLTKGELVLVWTIFALSLWFFGLLVWMVAA